MSTQRGRNSTSNSEPLDETDFPMVKILAKGVSAGAVQGAAGLELRIAVQFSPLVVDEGKYLLSQWPREIRAFLEAGNEMSTLKATFTSTDSKILGFSLPLSFRKVASTFNADGGDSYTNISTVLGLWQDTFESFEGVAKSLRPSPKAVWTALASDLKQSTGGSTWTVDIDSKKEANGQVVTDILANAQRQQALALELLRARETIDSITGARLAQEKELIKALAQTSGDKDKGKQYAYTSSRNAGEKHTEKLGRSLIEEARSHELQSLEANWAATAKAMGQKTYCAAKKDLDANAFCAPEAAVMPPAVAASAVDLADTETTAKLAEATQPHLDSHAYTMWRNSPAENTPTGGGQQQPAAEAGAVPRQNMPADDDVPAEIRGIIQQRFYNIQSTPTLSRLFLLTADAVAEVPANRKDPDGKKIDDGLYWLTLGVLDSTRGELARPTIRTLVRLQGIGSTGPVQFWPAQRAEIANATGHGIEQQHGLVRLGSLLASGRPRFDLSSLDIRSTTERAYERSRRRSAVDPSNLEPKVDSDSPEPTDGDLPTAQRDTLTTAGLTLLDGDRQSAIARRLAAREFQNNIKKDAQVDLDSEDLVQGYVIDVAVGTVMGGQISQNWRPLMNRSIDFANDNPKVRGLIASLTGPLKSPERLQFDTAMIAPSLKFNPVPVADKEVDEKNAKKVQSVVEEIIATWDGGPMGVDCSGSKAEKNDPDDLPFGRVVDLPTDNAEAKPPLLRFGRSYRFGMRSVFQGGVTPDLAYARTLYATVPEMAFPPGRAPKNPSDPLTTAADFRRFLRHERIGPPNLLLPESEAFESNDVMGYRTGKIAVIRSVYPADGDTDISSRAAPETTSRYLLPPGVGQAFAAMHGEFDGQGKETVVRSRLKTVVTNPHNGGFPLACNVMREGLNAEPYIAARERGLRATGPSEGIFTTNAKAYETKFNNKQPYFPDPMASFYVVALRHAGTDVYLSGAPAIAKALLPGEDGVTLPLKLTICKAAMRNASEQADHGSVLSAVARKDIKEPAGSGQTVSIQEISICLAPGDDFEADVWCVPTAEDLQRNFAVVEMIGALALHKGKSAPPVAAATGAASWSAFWKGMQVLFNKEPECEAFVAEQAALCKPEDPWLPYAGPFGMEVPGLAALGQVGKLLYTHITNHPLREISAITTFRVIHATNVPVLRPKFPNCDKEKECKPIAARRLTRERMDNLSVAEKDRRYGLYFNAETLQEKSYPDEGAHDFVLGGTVKIDTDSSSSFRIRASTVFPRSPLFDDPSRRRSAIHKRKGTWPKETSTVAVGAANVTALPVKSERFLPPVSLYGFHVTDDGQVLLPATEVNLLSVTNLATSRQAGEVQRHDGLESLQLDQLYGILDQSGHYKRAEPAGDKDESASPVPSLLKSARVKLEHAFPDGKARQLKLSLESISRHAQLMTTATRQDDYGNVISGNPLNDESDSLTEIYLGTLWLNSTSRPAKPETRSPLPSFLWDPPKTTSNGKSWQQSISRRSVVRIPIKRGWYSSGEGELLGLVLWPPNLFNGSQNKVDLGKDEILYQEPWRAANGSSPEDREISLEDFADEDLGPGGAFVTRWGGDPIRGSAGGQVGNFIPPGQFADYRDVGGRTVAGLADTVFMPVTRSGIDASAEKTLPGKDKLSEEFMTVSLLTYEPRFDVDREEWFVDVDLTVDTAPDPFVRIGLVRYQPHAPRYLQVSEPVVEWTQLLAPRTLEVSVEATDAYEIKVKVKGLAATDMKMASTEDNAPARAFRFPVLKVLLVKEENIDGTIDREIIAYSKVDNLDHNELSMEEAQVVWFKSLRVEKSALKPTQKLYVSVEEVDVRPRASFDIEPIPLLGSSSMLEEEYRESGPRFVARMEVPWEPLALYVRPKHDDR